MRRLSMRFVCGNKVANDGRMLAMVARLHSLYTLQHVKIYTTGCSSSISDCHLTVYYSQTATETEAGIRLQFQHFDEVYVKAYFPLPD